MSSARFQEEQKQAERSAKLAQMKKKRQLELAKVNLRLQEEELQITTEMAISDAKSKVIDRHEQFETDPDRPRTSDALNVNYEDESVKSLRVISQYKCSLNPTAPSVVSHVKCTGS